MGKVWKSRSWDRSLAEPLIQELHVSSLLARLVMTRGIDSVEAARTFLSPDQETVPDPFEFSEMEAAVERIGRAIRTHETILVHGDYDVDGITSTAILYETLLQLGANVSSRIPHRIDDGYDLRVATVEQLDEDISLLVTVDCGSTAIEAIQAAVAHGIDVIVTDHHDPGHERPPVVAILNPMREEEAYPSSCLCGAGVAWKLACALRRELAGEEDDTQQLELLALGMVADVVPIVGENRVLLSRALAQFKQIDRPGLLALMEQARVIPARISTEDIGFRLGPRLNAAGRMDSPQTALELLMTDEEETAESIARHLSSLNQKRQTIEKQITQEAEQSIEAKGLLKRNDRLLYVSGAQWHRGVIGIVAARLMRRYGRPVFLLSVDHGVAHGSARSFEGASLVPLLDVLREHSLTSGGHGGAAGMSVSEENLPVLEEALYAAAETAWPEPMSPPVWVDAPLPLERVDDSLMNELERLKPFGRGNEEPVFWTRATPNGMGMRVVGNGHLQAQFQHPGGSIRAIGFGMGERMESLSRGPCEILYHCRYEEYNGRRDIGLHLVDIKPASESKPVIVSSSEKNAVPKEPAPVVVVNAIDPSRLVSCKLDRERLGTIYRLLNKSCNEEKKLDRNNAYLLAQLEKVSRDDFDIAVHIFAELQLLQLTDAQIEIAPVGEKRDLEHSPTFQALLRHHPGSGTP